MKLFLASALALLVGCAAKCVYPTRILTESQIEGAWLGASPDEVHLYRLQLEPTGGGKFATIYSTNPPSIYQIDQWHLQQQTLSIDAHATNQESEPLRLQGRVVGQTILLSLRGSGWRRDVTLRPEGEFDEKLQKLKSAMAAGP